MNDSERELLKAWLEAAGADGPDNDHKHREHQKFLRVLNEVKAEAWDVAIYPCTGLVERKQIVTGYSED